MIDDDDTLVIVGLPLTLQIHILSKLLQMKLGHLATQKVDRQNELYSSFYIFREFSFIIKAYSIIFLSSTRLSSSLQRQLGKMYVMDHKLSRRNFLSFG